MEASHLALSFIARPLLPQKRHGNVNMKEFYASMLSAKVSSFIAFMTFAICAHKKLIDNRGGKKIHKCFYYFIWFSLNTEPHSTVRIERQMTVWATTSF